MLVKLKNIISTNHEKGEYDWESLRKSIITEGYNTEKYESIWVTKLYKDFYLVMDGNHRFIILKEIYDDEHEIEVKLTCYFDVVIKNRFLIFENIINISFFILFMYFTVWYIYTKIFFIIKYHKNKLFIKK
jgi:hypothetical protein